MSMAETANSRNWRDPGSIVGRDDERARLREIIDEVERSRGQLVLISGEAGIGKTALIEHVIACAEDRPWFVLTGHCYDFLAQTPYAPWIAVLRSLLRAVDHPPGILGENFEATGRLDEILDRDQFFESVSQLLEIASQSRPVLIVIEDLHWADQASLELLRFLTRYPIEHAMMVIGSYRDDELDHRSHLFPLLHSLIRDGHAYRIHLQRLQESSIEEIVSTTFDLTDRDRERLTRFVHRLAEGNPFYTWEMLRSLELDGLLRHASGRWILGDLSAVPVPALVRQMIDARLAALSPETRAGLEIASVIGGDVSFDLWLEVAGIDESDLATVTGEATQAHLLIELPRATEFRFSHELVREALYQGLNLPRRRALHRAVAESLLHAETVDPSVIASHFRAADDPRAVEWLLKAGIHAYAVYATHDAIAHLTGALERAGHLDRVERTQAYTTRAHAFQMTGDFERAQRDLETALELAREGDDERAEWHALIDLGMLWAQRDYQRTYDFLRRALDLARTIDDVSILAGSLNRMGNWHLNNDEPARSEAFHLEALEIFRRSDDESAIADTLNLLGVTRYMMNIPELSASNYREAISLYRKLDRRQGLSSSLVDLMLTGGSYETTTVVPAVEPDGDSITHGEEALAIARDIGWRAGETYALSQTALALGLRGSYRRALEMAEQSLAIATNIAHRQWAAAAHLSLGSIYLDLLLPEARSHLVTSRALSQEINSRFWHRMATGLLARHYYLLGDVYAARTILDETLSRDIQMLTIGERTCWLVRAELELAGGDAEASLDIADRLIATAHENRPADVIPELWRVRSTALLSLQRSDEAIETLREAREWAARAGWAPLLWRIDIALARAYSQSGAESDASSSLKEAEQTVEGLARHLPKARLQSSFLAQARSRFPDHVRGPVRRDGFSPLDLSVREVEVLRMIADGHTDREIAQLLSISPRTVTNHVSNIFNKLGVNSRAAAAAHAIRNQII